MFVSGVILGVIALALAVVLAVGVSLELIKTIPSLIGAAVFAVLIVAGLLLSGVGLFRARRRRAGMRMPASALVVNVVAIVAAVAGAVMVSVMGAEPTFEETILELGA